MPGKGPTKRITFRFHAPEARNVSVAGDFNGWDSKASPLKSYKDGLWMGVVTTKPGTYQYRFIVDGVWQDDPTCEERFANEFGSSNNVIRV